MRFHFIVDDFHFTFHAREIGGPQLLWQSWGRLRSSFHDFIFMRCCPVFVPTLPPCALCSVLLDHPRDSKGWMCRSLWLSPAVCLVCIPGSNCPSAEYVFWSHLGNVDNGRERPGSLQFSTFSRSQTPGLYMGDTRPPVHIRRGREHPPKLAVMRRAAWQASAGAGGGGRRASDAAMASSGTTIPLCPVAGPTSDGHKRPRATKAGLTMT